MRNSSLGCCRAQNPYDLFPLDLVEFIAIRESASEIAVDVILAAFRELPQINSTSPSPYSALLLPLNLCRIPNVFYNIIPMSNVHVGYLHFQLENVDLFNHLLLQLKRDRAEIPP